MTEQLDAEDKTALSRFLDLAEDYLSGGYAREREEETPLPLAYMIEEPAGSREKEADYPRPDTAAPRDTGGADSLAAVAAEIGACTACGLCSARNHPVPGEGAARPLVMIIGEGPGGNEDASGRPFVGSAGRLLDRMLESIGLSRGTNCFIANAVKCRPPENRDPEPEELRACFPFLERQIALLAPRIILCAGRIAAQTLLKTSGGLNSLRGTFAAYTPETAAPQIPVLCTYHPSALLMNETLKRPAWEDLKLLRAKLEELTGEA